ncbi:MAG: low molecular weight protein-tyrosine-phosphatase [Pseudomonadota bacterium]
MFRNILVVCVGNICRSPVGEALLRQRFPERSVRSAGVAAMVDRGADPTAAEIAAQDGLDLGGHSARQLDEAMIREADLILVMTQGQRRTIAERSPAASGKTMLFGQWLDGGGPGGREIPDPNGKSREVFEQVHALLTRAADSWKEKL